MKSQNVRYLPAVDQLRGMAAVLILLYHGMQIVGHRLTGNPDVPLQRWHTTGNPFLAVLLEGHTAVALFFVLSGFIFTFGNRDRTLRWKPFLQNRLLRIVPLTLLCLMLGVAAFPGEFRLPGFLQHLLLMSNTAGAGHFGTWTDMFWTISVEFQFYLVFPFLLYFAQTLGVRYLLRLASVLIVLRCVAGLTGGHVRDMTYWSLVGRADQFLFGMALGFWYQPGRLKGIASRQVVLLAGLAAVVGMLHVFHVRLGGFATNTWLKLLWPTVEGAAWTLFVFAWLEWSPALPEAVSRPLCGLGTISFSIYLLHFVVIQLVVRHGLIVQWGSPVESAVATTLAYVIPLTVALATLTFREIEKPFLQLRVAYQPATENRTLEAVPSDRPVEAASPV